MKKYFTLTVLSLVFLFEAQAQSTKYRVFFTDKNNTPYSIANPSAFLSARAIQRRINQNISITQQDLPVDPAYVQQVMGTGAVVLHTSRWFNSVTISVPNPGVLSAVQALPCVQSTAAVNRIVNPLPEEYKIQTNPAPADLQKKAGLHLMTNVYDYGQSLAQVQQLGGDCMHNQGYDGKGMVICVLDAGFLNADTLSCFDSLHIKNQILGTWDFVANHASVYEDNSHGAMVLSCMGANQPGVLVGTAPQASYWLLRTEDAASELVIEEDNWLAGAEFADSVGADIINSSLGYTTFDISSQNHSYATLDGNTALGTIAADLAASKGILVCNSAGNEGASAWKYISVPADGDSVCTVGATDLAGVRAGFSSQGPTADGRIKPDVAACGNGTSVVNPFAGGVQTAGGTSFSSPLTAGMAACLWQANPSKNNMEILDAMRSAGNQASNPDTLLGWGIPNYCTANIILGGIEPAKANDGDQLVNAFYDDNNNEFIVYYFSHYSGDISIRVHDISGKLHLNETRTVSSNAYNFLKLQNTNTLSTGIYIISISTSDRIFTRKILKY